MKTIIHLLLTTNANIGFIFLSLSELVWGVWFLNPIVSGYLQSNQFSYFDPPMLLGVAAILLGFITLFSIVARWRYSTGIYHVIFWSYLAMTLGQSNLAGSGLPLYITISAASVLFHVLDAFQRDK